MEVDLRLNQSLGRWRFYRKNGRIGRIIGRIGKIGRIIGRMDIIRMEMGKNLYQNSILLQIINCFEPSRQHEV